MAELENRGSITTKWKNPPTLNDLKQDYQAVESTHSNHVAKVEGWLRELNPPNSKAKRKAVDSTNPFNKESSATKSQNSQIQPKLIRKQAEWRYTSLSEPFLNTPDIFKVLPVTAEDIFSAKQNELVLNNQFNTKIDKVKLIDSMARTGVNEGTVILKVSWESETKTVTNEYPIYEIVPATTQEDIVELQKKSQLDPVQLETQWKEALALSNQKQAPYIPKLTEEVEQVEEEITVKNQPTVEVCNFRNVRIDPSCEGDLEAAEFVTFSYETNYTNMVKAGIYENLDMIKDSKSDSVIGSPDHESNWAQSGFKFSDAPRTKFVITEYWGYWDINGDGSTVPIVAAWVGDVMVRLEENPFPYNALPFVAIQYLPVKESVNGEPDGELLADNQAIAGALMRGMVDTMGKSANGQTGVKKGALDIINKRKFDKGMDYEFNDVGDAQNSIYMHKFPEIPMSAYTLLNMQNTEAESLSGVKSFANEGISGAGLGATAAAANGALGAAAQRELGILRRFADGMKQVARKIMAMNAEWLSEEEVVRITAEEFVPVRRDDLAGNFDLELRISTAEADEQKAKELAFMLQTTAQSFGVEFVKMILAEIADLRKMPHLSKMLREFAPQPDAHQQALQQLELAEKQAEIDKVRAETQKILSEARVAGAKESNINSDTDKKDLEFLEQQEGVTQAQELQKLGEQAKSNMELEAFKNLITPEKQPAQ